MKKLIEIYKGFEIYKEYLYFTKEYVYFTDENEFGTLLEVKEYIDFLVENIEELEDE